MRHDASGMLISRIPVTSTERMGATDRNCTRIRSIDVYDAFGYRGCGREEHSGENAPVAPADLGDELADNRAAQISRPEH
jgi:hypothetical protein